MRIYEAKDKYYWDRLKQAQRMGVDPSQLEDEPDYISSDMDWEENVTEHQ